jgi:general secretion pathway protein I
MRSRGFTLLEVMVAIAILSSALVVLLEINTRNIAATNHARMMTTATQLARAELVRLEDDLDEKGYPDLDDVRQGNFGDDGLPMFRWEAHIEKVELPGNLADQASKAATDKQSALSSAASSTSAGGFNPTSGGIGGAASVVLGQFDMIRNAIEQSIRKVTLRVYWPEGKIEKYIEVTTFETDASKVDQALPGLGALGGLLGGTGGTGGAGGTGGNAGRTGGTGGTGGGPPKP